MIIFISSMNEMVKHREMELDSNKMETRSMEYKL